MRRILTTVASALVVAAIAGCSDTPDHGSHDHGDGDAPAKSDTLVDGNARDPVCGKTVAVAGQPDSVYRDTRFHFCSADCLDKFKSAPSAATTGLPREKCICTTGGMKNCKCGHCVGEPERCECGDPKAKDGSGGHDHDHHDHDHK